MVHLPARQMTVLGPDFATDANGAPYLQVMQQKRSHLTPSDIGTSACDWGSPHQVGLPVDAEEVPVVGASGRSPGCQGSVVPQGQVLAGKALRRSLALSSQAIPKAHTETISPT